MLYFLYEKTCLEDTALNTEEKENSVQPSDVIPQVSSMFLHIHHKIKHKMLAYSHSKQANDAKNDIFNHHPIGQLYCYFLRIDF